MSKPKITINQDALNRAAAPAVEQQRVKLNEILQQTVREVNSEMKGQAADEIYAELVTRLQAQIPRFTVNEAALRRVAEEIADDTVTDDGV